MGLVMVSALVMAITVVATVGECHRGEAQRQGHREQQHYGQLSGQLLTSFLCDFSIQAQAWYPYMGTLIVGSALLFASPSSGSRRIVANEHDAPRSAGCHRAFRLFHS